MKAYLSAPTARAEELRAYAEELTALDVEVVSRWLTTLGKQEPGRAAAQDVADLRRADVFIAFTGTAAAPGRGGRHVELGIALAHEIPVIVVGDPEHLFHHLAGVDVVDDWPAALQRLRALTTLPVGSTPRASR